MYTDKDILAGNVVDHILKHDLFSRELGIELIDISEGFSKIKMLVRPEMVNGLCSAHGSIAFSLADSCFDFACNNRNVLSDALDTSINFVKPVHPADELTAVAKELHHGKSTGFTR